MNEGFLDVHNKLHGEISDLQESNRKRFPGAEATVEHALTRLDDGRERTMWTVIDVFAPTRYEDEAHEG